MVANITDAWNINEVILISKSMLSWIYFNLPDSVFRLTCDSTSNLFQLHLLLLSNVLLISTCTLIHNVGKSVNVDEWYSNIKLSSTYVCNWVPLLWSSKNSWVLICIHTCYGPCADALSYQYSIIVSKQGTWCIS